jgi:hypothetical protein
LNKFAILPLKVGKGHMRSFLRRARDSEAWRAINDILAIQALIALAVGAVSAISAWTHGQPLYVVLFWGFAASTVALGTVHIGWNLWEKRKRRKDAKSDASSPKEPEPNLVFKTPVMGGGLILRDNVWTHGYSDSLRYVAWIVPIKNEAVPGKEVSKAERITAEIVLSSGGTSLLEVSPAPWVGEASRKIDIQSPDTKQLIVAFKESGSGCGYWEMDFRGIPMGCSRGELKIRLLRERDSRTSHLATKFYKWKRAPELGDFWIEER